MDQYKLINLPPSAASLVESLRDIGYSIETAVADDEARVTFWYKETNEKVRALGEQYLEENSELK